MAANKILNFEPLLLTATLTTNLLNPNTSSGGVNAGSSANYIIVKHARIVNRTGGAVTCSFWKGATGANAAGTETLFGTAQSVPANSFIEWFGLLRFDAADFLVGGASAANSLVLTLEGEIGVA